ncbi:MAG TPA: PAS domain-containing sensor histidine kinase, partial [Rhizobiaceae bacterium]|nr:PAS domain-containing sensor histidine kinase [Rhizobiaceae bacterium]
MTDFVINTSKRRIVGQARIIAQPAYHRLLAAEPVLRRSIPILILIFLIVIFASRASVLLEERDRLLEEAQYGLSLTVANAAGALSAAGVGAERGDIERVLVERLPKGASQNGRKLA